MQEQVQVEKLNGEVDVSKKISPMVRVELDKVKKKVLKKDMDFVCIIDGEEGVGKSVLAQQWAAYLDPNFNLDKIVFNSEDFIAMIRDPKTKKGSCIVLDEAFNAASARASLTEVNRAMLATATEMRQKNLFILMVLPSFFDLDRYFALWRCKALVHLYFSKEGNRRYILFSKNEKKLLYILGKKTYSYAKPHASLPPFWFPNYYTVDEDAYRLKKAEAFRKRKVSARARTWLAQRNAYAKYILKVMGKTQEETGQIPAREGAQPLSHDAISLIMKELGDYK